jgi:WD40 repeat protein
MGIKGKLGSTMSCLNTRANVALPAAIAVALTLTSAHARAGTPAPNAQPKANTSPALDQFSEPLPAGAVARLGFTFGPRYARSYPGPRAAFSPDGKLLATLGPEYILLWDTATGKLGRRIPLQLRAHALAFSSATTLEIVDETEVNRFLLRTWDVAKDEFTRPLQLRYSAGYGNETFSADGRLLAVTTLPGPQITVMETATRKIVYQLHDHADHVLAFSGDGKSLLIASDYTQAADRPQRLRVVEVASRRVVVRPLARHTALLAQHRLDDPLILIQSFFEQPQHRSAAVVLQPHSGKELSRFAAQTEKDLWSLALSPDGKTLALGDKQGITLREPATGKLLRRLPGTVPEESAGSLAFSRDGQWLALGGEDGSARLWHLTTGKLQELTPGHKGRVFALGFSTDGKLLASRAADDTVRVWDVEQRREINRFTWKTPAWHFSDDQKLVFSADGRFLFQEQQSALIFWDLSHSRQLERPFGALLYPNLVSASGRTMAVSLSTVNSVDFFQPVSPQIRATVDALCRKVRATNPFFCEYHLLCASAPFRFSPDGSLLLEKYQVRDDTQVMRLAWNFKGFRLVSTVDGKILKQLSLPQPWRDMLEFSPDGKRLAVLLQKGRQNAGQLVIYETRTGQKRIEWPMDRHTDAFLFSAGGRFLIAADRRGDIGIWDCLSARRIAGLPAPKDATASLALSHDGKYLASGNNDGSILIWDLARHLPRRGTVSSLTDKQLEQFWQDLAGQNVPRAFKAMDRLEDAADQTVDFLKGKILDPTREKRAHQLMSQLDNKKFAVREKALVELEQMGETTAPLIHKAMQSPNTLEKQLRLQKLLDNFDPPFSSPAGLRLWRCLEILESIDTPAARNLLRALARGTEDDPVAREARLALVRLENSGGR